MSDSIESYRGYIGCSSIQGYRRSREVTEEWISDYNQHRPHDALGGYGPSAVSKKMKEIKHLPLGLRSASAPPSLHYAPKDLNQNIKI
ncbi:MAG: integrase core domain-containing protein [Chitinophagaceae bacterium]